MCINAGHSLLLYIFQPIIQLSNVTNIMSYFSVFFRRILFLPQRKTPCSTTNIWRLKDQFLRLYQQFLVPNGLIHLKTDSPDLYKFTKLVIDLYGCPLHKDMNDVLRQETVSKELKIKTHYESLDIAGSNRIHYLSFSLPENLHGKEKDEELKQRLKEYERAD